MQSWLPSEHATTIPLYLLPNCHWRHSSDNRYHHKQLVYPTTNNQQTKRDLGAYSGPEFAVCSWYYTFLSGEKPTLDQFGPNGNFSANFQLNIDAKLYPQFLADVQDAWHMTRNMFDANALALTYGSSVQSIDQFTQAQFLFGVGLDHHSDDAGKDHLISGLNTTGSLIPITFSANLNTAD